MRSFWRSDLLRLRAIDLDRRSPASLLRALRLLSPIAETGPSLPRLPPHTSHRASEGLLSVVGAENLSHRLLDTQHERFERSSSRPKAHRRRLKAGASQR